MHLEQLKKGNALQLEIKNSKQLKENYVGLLGCEIQQNYQILRTESNADVPICMDKLHSPKLNEIFHDELRRFLEIMAYNIEKHIQELEKEFENLKGE